MTYTLSIHSNDDLDAAWRFVDQGLGYSAAQTFALIVETDGSVLPTVIQIYDDDLDADDREPAVAGFVAALRQVGEPGASIAVMRARPGSSTMDAEDRQWCRVLHEQLSRAGVTFFPLYFATDHSLGPVPPDVLVDAA